ncbi:hypothetical protein CLRAG_23880 [Clostridium ragsdalei P11]|uniref:Uncharacterized protein n=1 Tax=Clostridium ragsdalei P11 TaxID=1353534 RepID=A0A1A6ARJ5_9CLOT|nr:hypothetical protein [Clostridium ragsdalei]OBR92682.1 hypothetical protein CLRAG_23880 [Clostridium ragsdalei P11]
MIVDKFETPAGSFKVYKNSKICPFSIEESAYNTFWLNGNKTLHPEGCYKISLDLTLFSVGDIISCELDNGEMVNDGGGENTLNIVGEIGDYTIGIGAPDSDSIEEGYSQDELPKDMNHTQYELPYDTIDITKRGYIFKIKDTPSEYRDRNFRKYIELSLVWEKKEKDYSWEIVSYLTC